MNKIEELMRINWRSWSAAWIWKSKWWDIGTEWIRSGKARCHQTAFDFEVEDQTAVRISTALTPEQEEVQLASYLIARHATRTVALVGRSQTRKMCWFGEISWNGFIRTTQAKLIRFISRPLDLSNMWVISVISIITFKSHSSLMAFSNCYFDGNGSYLFQVRPCDQ